MNNAMQCIMEIDTKAQSLAEVVNFQQDATQKLQKILKKMPQVAGTAEGVELTMSFIKITAEIAGYSAIIKKKAMELNGYLV